MKTYSAQKPKPKARDHFPQISSGLEFDLLRYVIRKEIPADVINPKTLSAPGLAVFRAAEELLKNTNGKPITREVVRITALAHADQDPKEVEEYLKDLHASPPDEEAKVIRAAYRETLLEANITNALNRKDYAKVISLASSVEEEDALLPLGEEPEDMKRRFPLPSFPLLTRYSKGGLSQIWTIIGDTGHGKSTLATQIAVEMILEHGATVLYYDLDYSVADLQDRIKNRLLKFRPDAWEKVRPRIFKRKKIDTAWADVEKTPAPRVVIVDTVQTLPPVGRKSLHETITEWLRLLRALTNKEDTCIIALSQKSRAEYGNASIKSGRESSAIEDSAKLMMVMSGDSDNEDIPVLIPKNREGKKHRIVLSKLRDPNDPDEETSYLFGFAERAGAPVKPEEEGFEW